MEMSGQLHATQPLFENMGGKKKQTPTSIEYKAGWATEPRFEKKKRGKHFLAPFGETRLHSSVIQPVD
jgi:hypothetical protein